MPLALVDAHVPQDDPVSFDDFWLLYPRRVAKKDAQRAWARIDPRKHAEILTSLASWRRVWLGRGEQQFVPYPATWLNGERWEDELPKEGIQAHQLMPARAPDGPRTAMPDAVRALLARLRSEHR